MPTALSSTETGATYHRSGHVAAARRAVVDVGILFQFRKQAVRRRHLARVLSLIFAVVTVASAVVPAFLPGAAGPDKAFDILLLVPSAMAGLLALNVASAIASGGGRELISRDHASPYPISPTTDHLGALLLAPLNIAWMLQSWTLLGSVAYATPGHLLDPDLRAALMLLVTARALHEPGHQRLGDSRIPARWRVAQVENDRACALGLLHQPVELFGQATVAYRIVEPDQRDVRPGIAQRG